MKASVNAICFVSFSAFVTMSSSARYHQSMRTPDSVAIYSASVEEEAGHIPDQSHYEVGGYDAEQRGAKARRDLNKMWAAEGQLMKNKWAARKQLHDVNQKLASDYVKAHMKVLSGVREGDPVIGDKATGKTILRVARKSDDVSRTPGVAAFTTGYAYVLNEEWEADKAMKVEDEVSYLRDDEVAILYIQGAEPWKPDNLKMTLQLVHMFEEYGGWITISTEGRWAKRSTREVWFGLPLQQVMQQHYGTFLTDEAIDEAMTITDDDHLATFGSWTLQAMPAYYPTGYARKTKNGDTVTFLPSDVEGDD